MPWFTKLMTVLVCVAAGGYGVAANTPGLDIFIFFVTGLIVGITATAGRRQHRDERMHVRLKIKEPW